MISLPLAMSFAPVHNLPLCLRVPSAEAWRHETCRLLVRALIASRLAINSPLWVYMKYSSGMWRNG